MSVKSGLVLSALLGTAAARGCPADMAVLRSPLVAADYNAEKLSGFFYEIAFEDIMQKGETCQWFNETIISGGISEQFGFTYSNPGSTSVAFEDTGVPGVYLKYMGSSNTGMPTVVVDVTENADGTYETVTEYTCFADGVKVYEEIKIGARTPSVSAGTMSSIENTLQKVGISTDSLTYVSHDGCEYAI